MLKVLKLWQSLPSREVLACQSAWLACNLRLSGFVNVLQGTIRNLVYALEAVRKQKESA